jgi:Icc-related predicted phosphoesterase
MRRFGIEPSTALEQAQRDQSTGAAEPFQPLPAPTGKPPFRLAASMVKPGLPSSERVIHIIGDHGGVKDPTPQVAVAKAMIADIAGAVDYCYSVGDVVYFNGAKAEYPPQFYEAYAHYNLPILAIPGNHDGDPEEDGETSLEAFVRYFCDATPQLLPEVAEYNRDTMDQPNVFWTLEDELVTIIGLYSNVPSGGVIEQEQQEWLVEELKAAAHDRALIVALHHPPLSCDAHHGGSEAMGKVLDEAFRGAMRAPDLILSGHVHNYQRFARTQNGNPDAAGTPDLLTVPYIVCGAGGYHNLHAMASEATPGMEVIDGVKLEAFDATQWGFLRLTITTTSIAGEYIGVDREGTVTPAVDSFTVPVG